MNKTIFLLVILTGFGAFTLFNRSQDKNLNLDVKGFKDATYEVDGEPVTLKNGLSEINITGSVSKIVTKYFGNEAIGDFNKDGIDDVAFLLIQNSGGSGTFYYVTVALGGKNGYTGINALFLGDRIAPQTTEFRNGEIIVNYAERYPSEPMTAFPSLGVSKYFKVENNKLIKK